MHVANFIDYFQKSTGNLNDNYSYSTSEELCLTVLNCHVPLTKQALQYSNSPGLVKTLWKTIMVSSCLKNIYLKNENEIVWQNYKIQRRFCTNSLKDVKKDYFANIDITTLW